VGGYDHRGCIGCSMATACGERLQRTFPLRASHFLTSRVECIVGQYSVLALNCRINRGQYAQGVGWLAREGVVSCRVCGAWHGEVGPLPTTATPECTPSTHTNARTHTHATSVKTSEQERRGSPYCCVPQAWLRCQPGRCLCFPFPCPGLLPRLLPRWSLQLDPGHLLRSRPLQLPTLTLMLLMRRKTLVCERSGPAPHTRLPPGTPAWALRSWLWRHQH
jgi:hypothetical protein